MPHRICSVAVALCALATVVIFVSACGSATEQQNAVYMQSFADSDNGLSFRYPSNFVKVTRSPTSEDGATLSVALANPDGAVVDGVAVDTLEVSVYRLTPPAKPADIETHAEEFKAMAGDLLSSRDGLSFAQPLQRSNLGETPALYGEFTFASHEQPMAGVCYFVPKGPRVYWVTAQASAGTWERSGKLLGTCLSTFTFD